MKHVEETEINAVVLRLKRFKLYVKKLRHLTEGRYPHSFIDMASGTLISFYADVVRNILR